MNKHQTNNIVKTARLSIELEKVNMPENKIHINAKLLMKENSNISRRIMRCRNGKVISDLRDELRNKELELQINYKDIRLKNEIILCPYSKNLLPFYAIIPIHILQPTQRWIHSSMMMN